MKKFMYLHIGFEKPTEQIMQAWQQWFETIADRQVEQAGFAGGREITKDGSRELPWDQDSITGYNIITAENLDEAERLAQGNPFISGIRIYEMR